LWPGARSKSLDGLKGGGNGFVTRAGTLWVLFVPQPLEELLNLRASLKLGGAINGKVTSRLFFVVHVTRQRPF
jgi:hypothetical protein